ncbi:unnamed protein product, partial [marine sediment metagenome]
MGFNKHHKEITAHRLKLQGNYEPKLRELVRTRTAQLEFSDQERSKALKSLDSFVWKLTAAGVHLERLWENLESYNLDQLMNNIINDIPEPRRYEDEEIAFLTVEFEAFLFQARAIIIAAQIHTLDACRVEFGGMLTSEKYEKKVKNAPFEVRDRLIIAHDYFAQNVTGDGKWGALLIRLRDRIAHFDRIRPSEITLDDGSEEIRVAGSSLEWLAQKFEDGT